MSRRTAARVAWGLWSFDLLVVLAVLVQSTFSLLPVAPGSGDGGAISGAVFILVFATTGTLIASRLPGNPVGWLLCTTALAFAVGGVCVTISESASAAGWHSPVVTLAAWLGMFVWMLGVGPAATFVLLLFPDGHLPSPRWRPVGLLSAAAMVAITVGVAFGPGPIQDTDVSNPVGITAWGDALTWVEGAGLLLLLAMILASCASLVIRYRRSSRRARQQLKWLAWSMPMVLAWLAASIAADSLLVGDTAVDVSNTLAAVGLMIVPIAIAIAILRHRLYDIDLVIKRTLVYGSLSASLLATYLGLVLVLRIVLSPLAGDSDLAVAGSTLAVAALFGPLRSRIQSGVDRRFYRSRYDATRTVGEFGERLRQEVALESVTTDLCRVVAQTVAPTHVSLWLRSAP